MKIIIPNPCYDSGAIEQEWTEISVDEKCCNCENFMSLDYSGKDGREVGICKIALTRGIENGSFYDAIYDAACLDEDECFTFNEFVYKD